MQKLYKIQTTDVYKVYKRCTKNVSYILTNVCIRFVKELSLLKFVHKLYTKVCRNVGTFCIHLVYILYTSIKIIIYKNYDL